jgi:Lon protease-like protein
LGERIALFQLHTLLLPHTDLGVHVFEQRYKTLVSHSLGNGMTFGVSLIRNRPDVQDGVGGRATPHEIGTLAKIAGYARLPDGRYLLEVEGTRRFRIESAASNGSYPAANVVWLSEPIGNFGQARRASEEVAQLFTTYRFQNGDGDLPVRLPVDPVSRSYVVASLLRIDTFEKQRLLEAETAAERLDLEIGILQREIALLDHLRSKRG